MAVGLHTTNALLTLPNFYESSPRDAFRGVGPRRAALREWSSGRMAPCHGVGPGSIPGSRIHLCVI